MILHILMIDVKLQFWRGLIAVRRYRAKKRMVSDLVIWLKKQLATGIDILIDLVWLIDDYICHVTEIQNWLCRCNSPYYCSGIERGKIFYDGGDRAAFVKRLGQVLLETRTDCLAWGADAQPWPCIPESLQGASLPGRSLFSRIWI